MEGERNRCCDCKFFDWYYETENGGYVKSKFGWCAYDESVVNYDSCMGCYRARKNLTPNNKRALIAIVDLLTQITDLCKRILEDDEAGNIE